MMQVSAGLQRLVVLLCLSVTTIGMLPVFLVAALAGEIRGDLAVDEGTIGILVASFFAVSATTSMAGGRYIQRTGWPVGIFLVGLTVAICSALIASVHFGVAALALTLMIAGIGNGLSHPSANLGLVRSISSHRRGMAFGVKQAAVPAATLLAGAALPFIAVEFGWRAPFALLAGFSLGVGGLAWLLRSRVDAGIVDKIGAAAASRERPGIILLSIGAGLGSAAANSMGAFLVVYALHLGVGPGLAGGLLMVGSLANIAVRLLAGWQADRRSGGHLRIAAVMMFVGTGGVAVLPLSSDISVLVLATLVAFGVGWGWNGLLHHGAMEIYADSAASATSVIQGFLFWGAVIGPLTFGLTAEHVSYTAAWVLVAVSLGAGGFLILRFLASQGATRATAARPVLADDGGSDPS
jgi:MFS family permease